MLPVPALGAEQEALVEKVRTLARERFAPRAGRYDAESIFPAENYADLRAAGLLGLSVPAEYGGRGADSLTYALCLLEMAKGCSATALTFNMHATVLTFIAALGTEEQKRRYFAEVVRDGKLMASITSEPESSFRDKFVLQTVFRPVAGGYQVSGVKQFCSLGRVGRLLLRLGHARRVDDREGRVALGAHPAHRSRRQGRGHLERHGYARDSEPHHPLRDLRGREPGHRSARGTVHHRPLRLRAWLLGDLPRHRGSGVRLHPGVRQDQDHQALDGAPEPSPGDPAGHRGAGDGRARGAPPPARGGARARQRRPARW